MTRPLPVSWDLHKEILLLAGWGRAILLQIAHPLVAEAVARHSDFRGGGFGRLRRLHRTLGAMLTLTFGTPTESDSVIARINGIHDRVNGRLPHPAGRFVGGAPYSARDSHLLEWVHVTCVDSFLLAYETFVARLTVDERDAYCREAAEIEPRLGMRAGSLPRTYDALGREVRRMLESGELHVGPTARELGDAVLSPPLAWLAWPAVYGLRLATAGLLPPAIRDGYRLLWTPRHDRALGACAAATRRLLPLVPPPLRYWPLARRAFRRQGAPIRYNRRRVPTETRAFPEVHSR